MLVEILLTTVIGLAILIWHLLHRPTSLWTKEGMNIHGPGSRRLGTFEQLMATVGERSNSNISTIIFIRSTTPMTKDIVHRALTALSQKHPQLRMRLWKENGRFSVMKEMKDFKVDLEVCHTDNWLGLMEAQLPKIYDAEKGPLWNVKLIPEPCYDDGEEDCFPYQVACIFAFHHSITDGPSFLRLFGDFVDGINKILDNDKPVSEPISLLPPLDAYIDNANIYSPIYNLKTNILSILGMPTLGASILIMLLKNMYRPALLVKMFGVEIARNPKAPRKTCFIPVELTKEQTSQLEDCCKRHKTTVQSTIMAAACVAYSEMIYGGNVKQTQKINCRVTCNLRRFLSLEELPHYFGMYFLMFLLNTKVGQTLSFWDIVGNVAADLESKLKSHEPFLFFTLSTLIANSKAKVNPLDAVISNFPGQRSLDLGINNYGNFNFLNKDEQSHVKITGYFGGAVMHNTGSVFENMLAIVNGKLSWTFQYFPHICTEAQAQKYANITMETLLKAIQE